MGEPCRAFFYVRHGSLTLSFPGQPDETLPAGSVIDQAELESNDCWRRTAAAADTTYIVVFRGRALELLRKELKLVRRE